MGKTTPRPTPFILTLDNYFGAGKILFAYSYKCVMHLKENSLSMLFCLHFLEAKEKMPVRDTY